ncbi:hypothetical protein VM1G_00854 [Cytospora mali]|uniref:Apple domain-containing protein n=1 Tax=Cytospora mali TaxID=578113 RepID=A0A194VKR8_CYTMA|nr:hypothetical protein VM1G_00854 [Valsa mali]
MAHSNQNPYFIQEPKTRLHLGMTGPKMAADTPQQEPRPNEDRKVPDAEDYSGLQVLETGLEVVPFTGHTLPEALPPHLQAQYAEYKPWPEYSPQQSLPPHSDAYSYPVPVDPDSRTATTASPPYGGGVAPEYRYHGGHNPFQPPGDATAGRRICGLRKGVFWAILAVGVFAIVAAVAIGLGVGLGTRSDAASSTTSSTASASSTTDTLPAATATSTAGSELSIICPMANRTVYSLADSSSDQKFLVLCGRDYNGCCGAVDIYSVNTTFEGCLERCGSQDGCVAVGWGNYYGTNTCWLKSAIGEPNWSESWYAAVLE